LTTEPANCYYFNGFMALLTLTSADNGKAIEVHPEDRIVIELPENATAGYRWNVDRAERLAEEDTPQEPPSPHVVESEPQFGRGGIRRLQFRAMEPGAGHLKLKYWQAWEGERSVLQRFAIDVKVTR
jgi:inhibitor of cysteine peptidase